MVSKRVLEKRERNKKDKEWRTEVIRKYGAACVICGEENRPNAHHIIPRTFKETRWDPENGIMLCPKHHKFGKFSAHKNPLWFLAILRICEKDKYNNLLKKVDELWKL